MLKDFYNKYNNDDEDDFQNQNPSNTKKEAKAIGIIFAVIILLAFGMNAVSRLTDNGETSNVIDQFNEATGNGNSSSSSQTETKDLFDSITNNYNLEVIKTENDVSYKLNYSKDANIIAYESTLDKAYGYIKHEKNLYQINSENTNLTKVNTNELDKYFDEKLYDVLLLRDVIKRSTKSTDLQNTYTLNLSDYFKEYNYKYNANHKPINDKEITIEYEQESQTKIRIKIDYTEIYKILYNETKNIIYEITISYINKNNYDNIVKVIEENY